MKTSITDSSDYIIAIKEALINEEAFNNLKRNPSYTSVLEHASYELGLGYLEMIKLQNPQLLEMIELFKQNDFYCNAKKINYDFIGFISPSTLRYLKVLSDIIYLKNDLNSKDIIEIGGGYGGQCLILSKYFKFKSYTLVDLPEPLLLCERYLKLNGVENVVYKNISELDTTTEYDYCISNYAFSECAKFIQDIYLNKVINRSKNGYMTLNFISYLFSVESYSKEEMLVKIPNSILIEEKPISCSTNKILIW